MVCEFVQKRMEKPLCRNVAARGIYASISGFHPVVADWKLCTVSLFNYRFRPIGQTYDVNGRYVTGY